MTTTTSESQARAQLATIVALAPTLAHPQEPDNFPLSIEVRGKEYNILLCASGRAVRIIGTLGGDAIPETAELEHRDSFTPWIPLPVSDAERAAMLKYARVFWYGGI